MHRQKVPQYGKSRWCPSEFQPLPPKHVAFYLFFQKCAFDLAVVRKSQHKRTVLSHFPVPYFFRRLGGTHHTTNRVRLSELQMLIDRTEGQFQINDAPHEWCALESRN